MKKHLLGLLLCAALPATSAHAEITFNGFANIVAGKASSGDQLWGYDDDVSFKQDSLFALQASTDLGEGLSATAQIVSRGENDWDATFEWAYLSYSLTDETQLLFGRQRVPMYIYSDYVDVSYAYPWITPPNGVYDLEISNFDGVSMNHSFTVGDFDSSVQFFYGSDESDVDVLGTAVSSNFDDVRGLALSLNRDWLTLRAAYMGLDLSIPAEAALTLEQAWRNIPNSNNIADAVSIVEDKTDFYDFALQVDYNNFLFLAEYTYIAYDKMPLDTEKSMYVTAGYRFDDILVHLTYGQDENKVNAVVNSLPKGVSPELDQLVGFTEQALRFREQDSSYYTLGARWDFHDSASLKLEFSSLDNDLINQDSSLMRTAIVTVF